MDCFNHLVSISDCGKWMLGPTIDPSDTAGGACTVRYQRS
jgi:hypothetical protein